MTGDRMGEPQQAVEFERGWRLVATNDQTAAQGLAYGPEVHDPVPVVPKVDAINAVWRLEQRLAAAERAREEAERRELEAVAQREGVRMRAERVERLLVEVVDYFDPDAETVEQGDVLTRLHREYAAINRRAALARESSPTETG